jgi:ABC-type dipeptide/oligopeptide/nickel transport system permease subunit
VTTVGGEDPPALGHADGQATRSDGIEGRGPWRLAAERLRHDRVAVGSLVVILVLIAWALTAPLIAHLTGHPANEQFHQTGQTPEGLPVGPRGEFWLGTDDLGRDLLVRIGYGLRLSLLVGIVAAVVTVAIGVLVGLAAGYLGGLTDTLLARLMDVVLAFPILLLAISMVSVLGPSLRLVILLIVLFSWASVARIVRGQVLSIRETEYVEAARAVGSSGGRIMLIDILPNTLAPVIVYTTLLIPAVMILEASLSFLGVGTPAPTADLGAMLSSSEGYYQQAWWFILFPGAVLLTVTVAFNLFGDGVRDAFDPRSAQLDAPTRRRR